MAKGIQIPTVQTGLEASISDAAKRAGPISLSASIDPSSFKRLAQPLGKVSGLATEFEKSIAASNARVIAFGASVGIINGIQNAFTDLVRTTVQVEKSLANIAAISGKTVDELKPFGKELFNIARETSQSFETAGQAALEFSRQGLSVEETLKRTKDALTLTRFTTLNAAEAVDVLTAAANSFGDTGITTAEIINKLVAVDAKFAVSAEDLANGLARAGSIAQEVGVSFDELNAAITVAQERTARGGAVIGNALKTIFTRLRSDETVQALRSIGVESLNAQGGLKGAVPLLQEVANQIKNLSEGERIQILEAIASKYNINILSALLNDLNAANSKFADVVGISAGASNEAYKRQIELNKILDSQINAVTVSVKQLFNTLGQIGVTENLSKLLGFVNDLLTSLNKVLDSKTTGGKIARGLIDGLSDVLFSVGLPLLAAIFVKLTKDIAQFGVESLKTILGINQQVRERQALEQAVVNTLIRDQEIMATILSLSGNRAKQEEYLLGVYNRQLAALQQVQNIATSVAPALQAGGLSATSGRVQRRAAGGYLPNQEASDIRRGVGGAGPSSKVVSIPDFAFGGGKRGTMVANTSEYIVPNFANGGSAIFNQDMVKAYGLPAGARKISAAGGYVPNFAKVFVYTGNGPMYNGQKYVSENALRARDFLAIKNISYKEASEKEEIDFLKGRAQQINEGVSVTAQHPQGSVMLIPKISEAQALNEKSEKIGIRPKNGQRTIDDKLINSVRFSAFGVDDKKLKSKSGRGMSEIEDRVIQVIGSAGARIVNDFKPLVKESLNTEKFYKIYDQKQGARGSASAVAGSIFEAATDYALNPNNAKGDTSFDVQSLTPNLIDVFSIKSPYGLGTKADYKISQERARDFADQIILNRVYKSIDKKTGSMMAAKGYIPNFAAGGPLEDAISREMAAGINPNKIRVTQDGRLRNSQNPQGLAVINTRDEPNGKIPNFADRKKLRAPAGATNPNTGRKSGGKFSTSGTMYEQAIGPQMPSAEQNRFEATTGKLMTAFIGLQLATSTLESTFQNTDSTVANALGAFGKISTSIAGYGSLGSLAGDMLKEKGGFAGQIGKISAQTGLLAGAVLGIITVANDYINEKAEALEKKRKEAGQSDIANILKANTGMPAEVQREALQEKRKEIESELAQRQRLIETTPYSQYVDGGKNTRTKDLEKVKDLQNQINNFKAKEFELTTEILNAGIRQSRERERALKKEKDELNSRIALEKVRISLSEAFAANELSFEKERNDRQLEYIKNEIFLSELQKNILKYREDFIKLQEKEFQLNASSVQSILEKVTASGQLSVAESLNVKFLENQLKAGKKVYDVRAEINALGIKGVSNLESIVLTELSSLKISQDKRQEEERFLEIRQKNIIQSQAQLGIERSILKAFFDRQEVNRQLFDDYLNYEVDSNLAENQRELLNLREQIASQPFATPEQEAQLGRLTLSTEQYSAVLRANADLIKQRNSIFRNTQKDFIAIFSETGPLNFLPSQTREFYQKNLADTVDLKDLEDALKISIRDIRETLDEEVDLSGLDSEDAADLMRSFEQAVNDAYGTLIEKGLLAEQQLITAEKRRNIAISQVKKLTDFEQKIKEIRESSPASAGLTRAFSDLKKEADGFTEKFSYDTTFAFRDGLRDAVSAAISQTDNLNDALQGVAMNFLKTMQNAFLNQAANNVMLGLGNIFPKVFPDPTKKSKGGFIKGYASGGKVTGGSGIRDDIPAMLSAGEYVIRKSSVQKYGENNLKKLNSGEAPKFAAGGFFLPGVRGAGEISGYKDLTAFAKQRTTSGATDILMGGQSTAFASLEDQSQRLSAYALTNDDVINQEVREAQERAFNVIMEREAYRTQQRKAFQSQLKQTAVSALLMSLTRVNPKSSVPDLGKVSVPKVPAGNVEIGPLTAVKFGGRAYGGIVNRYNAGGGPTDDIPALLMGGEYVMSRQATKKYGKQFFDSLNQGRAPRFADGGQVSTSEQSFAEKASAMSDTKATGGTNVNISINVTGESSQMQAEGQAKQDGVDYKKMSKEIEQIVLKTITEQKRAGGLLKPSR